MTRLAVIALALVLSLVAGCAPVSESGIVGRWRISFNGSASFPPLTVTLTMDTPTTGVVAGTSRSASGESTGAVSIALAPDRGNPLLYRATATTMCMQTLAPGVTRGPCADLLTTPFVLDGTELHSLRVSASALTVNGLDSNTGYTLTRE